MRWRYWYPQGEFPYGDLVAENRRRGRLDPEYELLDTGIFDGDRYWDITVDYAKAAADDLCIRMTVRNAGPDDATLHVLPTMWFRNTWSWGIDDRRKPSIVVKDGALVAEHHALGRMTLTGAGDHRVVVLRERDQRGAPVGRRRHHAVPQGRHQRPRDPRLRHRQRRRRRHQGRPLVRPRRTGGRHRRGPPAPGARRRRPRKVVHPHAHRPPSATPTSSTARCSATSTPRRQMIARQALAGMMWTKQWFHYDVERWLDGDPAGPPPPERPAGGRNREWRHLNNADVITVCDTWEYPWYATWDLAFQCVAIAHVDAGFAKDQLLLMCREWYMHPNGQLPAYEWAFGDVNPPVHAWAALRVFAIDAAATGTPDHVFLERIFHKLLLNFTWWVNRKDAAGDNVFEGGFLGMDNIGPIDRSAPLPVEGRLEQSDATGWMALFCLNMLEISLAARRALPGLRGHGHEVPRALRLHRHRDPRPRPVGRRRRLLLRRAADRRRPHPAARAVDGRAAAAVRGDDDRPGHAGAAARLRRPPAVVRHQQAAVRRPHRPPPRPRRPRGPAARHRRPGPPRTHPHPAARRVRAAVAARRAVGVGPPSRRAVHRRARRHGPARRLRPGRRHDRAVRRQLQLARAGVVPGQRPRRRRPARLRPLLRRRPHRRAPDRFGSHRRPGRRSPTTSPTASSPCSARDPTGGARCTGPTRSSTPTRRGTTPSRSTSTSTATPAPASAPPTRPAGPGSSPTCCCRRA